MSNVDAANPISRRTPIELSLVVTVVAAAVVCTAAYLKTQSDIAELRSLAGDNWTQTDMRVWIAGANAAIGHAHADLPTVDQVKPHRGAPSMQWMPQDDVEVDLDRLTELFNAQDATGLAYLPPAELRRRSDSVPLHPRRKSSGGRKAKRGQFQARKRRKLRQKRAR